MLGRKNAKAFKDEFGKKLSMVHSFGKKFQEIHHHHVVHGKFSDMPTEDRKIDKFSSRTRVRSSLL